MLWRVQASLARRDVLFSPVPASGTGGLFSGALRGIAFKLGSFVVVRSVVVRGRL